MARPRQSPVVADRITVRVDPKLATRLRVLAARQKRAISALVEEALAAYMSAAEQAHKAGKSGPIKVSPPTPPVLWTPDQIREELSGLGAHQYHLAQALGVAPALLSLWLNKRGIPFDRQAEVTKAIEKLRKRLGAR